MDVPQQLMTKIALITGANRGLGFAISRQLALQGITVLMGARDPQRGEEAASKLRFEGLNAHFVPLDVTDRTAIDHVVQWIEQNFGHLDILVNNAAVNLEYPLQLYSASRVPLDLLRQTFEINFFGVFTLTQALLPLIRKSNAGRIVNVSSFLASLIKQSDPTWEWRDEKEFAYNSSKTALNAFTIHLAHDLRATNIKVNSVDPGWIKTEMGGEDAPLSPEEGAETPVWLATLPDDGPSGGFFSQKQPFDW